MYYVGIDISKYKHDCFVCTETGEVIQENLSFANTNEGFNELLNLLKSLDNSKEIRIGFEATGHYGINLKLFLEKNDYSFMEFNPALVKKFIAGQTLRRTKTDKKDASIYIDEVQLQRNELYIELIDECQQSAVMMRVTKDGYLQIRTTAWVTVCEFIGGEISLSADCESNTVCVNGKSFQFYTSVNSLRGLTFRLGPTRRLPDRDTDSEIDEDLPYLREAPEDKATIFIRPMQS